MKPIKAKDLLELDKHMKVVTASVLDTTSTNSCISGRQE
jgi:hypothetical protein